MSDAERGAPAMLSGALCTDVLFNGAVACIEWMGSDKAGQPLTLASQLFQLHSHTCRLLHAVLAGRCRLLLPEAASGQEWYMLLHLLSLEVSGTAHAYTCMHACMHADAACLATNHYCWHYGVGPGYNAFC